LIFLRCFYLELNWYRKICSFHAKFHYISQGYSAIAAKGISATLAVLSVVAQRSEYLASWDRSRFDRMPRPQRAKVVPMSIKREMLAQARLTLDKTMTTSVAPIRLAAAPSRCSGLVLRLISAQDDPVKRRVRAYLLAQSDERLREGLGFSELDIERLRRGWL
jgi:hypothetical protein